MKIVISVIVANYNGTKFIIDCLQSVLKEKSSGYEIIVVDDASTDASVELIKKYFAKEKKVTLVELKKKHGSAGTRNEGAKYARGKYLLFLDLDTIIDKNWYRKILVFFEKYKRTALAQPKLLIKGTNKFDYAGDYLGPFGFLIERAQSAEDRGQFNTADIIFSLKGAAMLARKNIFEQIEGFDTSFEYMWEEPDYAWRVWLAGHEVRFMPQLKVWHAYGQKKKQYYFDNKVFYRGCRNTITSLIKNMSGRKLITVLPINIVCWLSLACLFILKLDFSKGIALLQGVLINIAILPQTLRKRESIQKNRKISEKKLFSLIAKTRSLSYYFNKAYTYVKQ